MSVARRINKPDSHWRETLSPEAYASLRCSDKKKSIVTMSDNLFPSQGVMAKSCYACAGCSLPLFPCSSKVTFKKDAVRRLRRLVVKESYCGAVDVRCGIECCFEDDLAGRPAVLCAACGGFVGVVSMAFLELDADDMDDVAFGVSEEAELCRVFLDSVVVQPSSAAMLERPAVKGFTGAEETTTKQGKKAPSASAKKDLPKPDAILRQEEFAEESEEDEESEGDD
eukprot:PhM_4_TR5572/c0_g1_i1/m.5865/K07305/msrB; peptide-methionine (R)-S-oxide reductase